MEKTNINSQLKVTQTVTLGGALEVTGTSTFNDQVAIVATDSPVSIFTSGLSITGTTTITGGVGINGGTTVTGTVTITGGTLNVTGTTTITGSLACTDLQLQSPSDKVTQILTKSVSTFFGTVSGETVIMQNITVPGCVLNDFNVVVVNTPDILDPALIVDATVIADDTVGLKLHNTSNGTTQAITATYNFAVFQFS